MVGHGSRLPWRGSIARLASACVHIGPGAAAKVFEVARTTSTSTSMAKPFDACTRPVSGGFRSATRDADKPGAPRSSTRTSHIDGEVTCSKGIRQRRTQQENAHRPARSRWTRFSVYEHSFGGRGLSQKTLYARGGKPLGKWIGAFGIVDNHTWLSQFSSTPAIRSRKRSMP